jgi:hypothetical protein
MNTLTKSLVFLLLVLLILLILIFLLGRLGIVDVNELLHSLISLEGGVVKQVISVLIMLFPPELHVRYFLS